MSSQISDFLTYQLALNHSAGTVEWYRLQLQRYLHWLGDRPQTAANIRAYLAASRIGDKDAGKKGNRPATVAGHWRALRSWYKFLHAEGYIDVNPMDGVMKPKVPTTEPRRAQLNEYLMLLESIERHTWLDVRDRLVITTLFLCGVRRSEAAGLIPADFRVAEHQLLVRQGKGGGDRSVPLLPAVERALVEYLFVRPPSAIPQLFLAANGHGRVDDSALTPSAIYQMLRRRCSYAGLRTLNPHSFRHGLAMYMLNQAGADMSLVQRILGHSQITTTIRFYAQWLDEGVLREYSEKMKIVGD